MTEIQLKILLLRLQDYTYEEIGSKMGRTSSGCRLAVHYIEKRARRALLTYRFGKKTGKDFTSFFSEGTYHENYEKIERCYKMIEYLKNRGNTAVSIFIKRLNQISINLQQRCTPLPHPSQSKSSQKGKKKQTKEIIEVGDIITNGEVEELELKDNPNLTKNEPDSIKGQNSFQLILDVITSLIAVLLVISFFVLFYRCTRL